MTSNTDKQSRRLLFRFFARMERWAARAQGKGYGAATIEQEVKLLSRFLTRRPLLAVDVGGNVGNYTQELRRLSADLEIHTFEPSATNIEKLRSRFQSDPLVKIIPMALSDSEGSSSLYSDQPGSGLGSLTQRRLDHFGIDFSAHEAVSTIRFDAYWNSALNCRPLDLVKIDVEGHELSVLNGFGEALPVTKVIQFEFGGCNIDTKTYFQDFWYYFEDKGFALHRITPFGLDVIPRYKEVDEFFSTTNCLAVNRRCMNSPPSA